MSRVTVAPTRRAATQIRRAFSSAIFSPSPGSAWPTALSLTLTSERAVQRRAPASPSAREQVEVRLGDALR